MMQKYRNPIRILRLAPGAQSIEPFDEYVSSNRVVEGRASEDDASSEKDSKPRTKRKNAHRAECKEKDDDEGFGNTTSDDGSSSSNGFIEDSVHPRKRTGSIVYLNHSYSTRGQRRQTRNVEQHRLERQCLVTSPASRTKKSLSDLTAYAHDVLSKKSSMEGESAANQLNDRFQDTSLIEDKRDGATKDRTFHHGNTASNSISPVLHPNHHHLDYNHLAVHGVKTMDGQWRLLPTTSSMQFSASRYHSPYYNIWRSPSETCYDYPVQVGQRVEDRSPIEAGEQFFEQSPLEGQGGSQQRTVQDDEVSSQQNRDRQVELLERGQPTFSHKGTNGNEQPQKEVVRESSSSLSNSIMTGWSSGSLSSRGSLSSSYSLSPATATEERCVDDPLDAGEPQNSLEGRRGFEKVPRLENRRGESHCFSSTDEFCQYPSSSLYRPNHSHEIRHDNQGCDFRPGETSSPSNSQIQFMSPTASRCHGPRNPQLPPVFISTISGEQCGPLSHLSASRMDSAMSRQQERITPHPAAQLDGNLHDRTRSFLNSIMRIPVPQETFCTGTSKTEVLPQEHWGHIYNSMAQFPMATQISGQGAAPSFVGSLHTPSEYFQAQGPVQDSCVSSLPLTNSFPSNLKGAIFNTQVL